jgi:cobalt transporter subunit CbtB
VEPARHCGVCGRSLVTRGAGAMSWGDVAVLAGALAPIYLGVLIGRWLRRRCPPGLFRALVLAALAIGGLQTIRAASSQEAWPGRRHVGTDKTGPRRLQCRPVLVYTVSLCSGGALMKALLAGMRVQSAVSTEAAAISILERLAAASVAALLGLGVVWGVGFSHVPAWHNAAHDTRHSMAFPCH